ncbi:MAG: LamG-like jellyroll fold domain-containing protein [Bacteroidota bacterium]|nr:LamG-like jellyroll fold domain-containing protein [Bacteroidota bacterium]
MKKLFFVFATILSITLTSQTYTVGAGNCLDFASNISSANHVNLGGLTAINNADFSFECWMKVNSIMDDEAFFSNKNWASGSNTGLVFDVQDNGANMKFNFKDPVNPRKDLTVPVNELRLDWFHFAGTYKKGGYFKVYINGVIKDSLDVSSITGSFLSSYTYKLGQDGTGNYTYSGTNPRYNGKIDEVRIWTAVRTQLEIRDNMCRKLTGTETNLYAYYNCDLASGTTLPDLSPSGNTGTLVSTVPAIWSTSGAAIGNVSVNKYASSFGTSTLQISNPTYGDGTVRNISGTAGIHLYRVTSAPNSTMGMNPLTSNNNYYGVFVTDTNNIASYDFEYNYTNYVTAMGDEPNLKLFNRVKNDGIFWSDYFATQNTTAHNLIKTGLNKRKEFVLGTKTGVTCNAPTSLSLTNNSAASATVSWVTGGSPRWNVQYGAQGFVLGNGTKILASLNNPNVFTGLASNTFYDVYVQDTCLSSGKSYWVGPCTYYGSVCMVPTALTATNITNNSATLAWSAVSSSTFDIEWGLPGFVLGTGIPANNISNPYVLSGLGPNTVYSYYVRTVCGSGNKSAFNGPYTFTTTNLTTGINANNISDFVFISPNPTNGLITVRLNQKSDNAIISVIDILGNKLAEEVISEGDLINKTFDLKNSAKGIYFISIKNGNSIAVKKVILN